MIEKVDNLILPDGSLYTGDYDSIMKRPFGAGVRHYPDGHEAVGTFCEVPNGTAYINFNTHMQLGYFTQGLLQGWGMQMGNGDYRFGVYHQGKLIKDCTQIFEYAHIAITELSQRIKAKGIAVRWAHVFSKNNEVFFGVLVKGYPKVGIRFMPSGDVFIGASSYSLELSGSFVHLKDSFIESGKYEKGILVDAILGDLFHSGIRIEDLHLNDISFDFEDEYAFEVSRLTRGVLHF